MLPDDLKCLVCQKVMSRPTELNANLAGCKYCGGLWLDNATSQVAARGALWKEVLLLASAVDAHSEEPEPPGYRQAAPVRDDRCCPECGLALARVRLKTGRIDLDVCRNHGTWFERGQLLGLHNAVHIQRAEERAEIEQFLHALRNTN